MPRCAVFILEVHAVVSLIFSRHILDITGLLMINNIPVLLGANRKMLTAFQEIMVIIVGFKTPVERLDTFGREIFRKGFIMQKHSLYRNFNFL